MMTGQNVATALMALMPKGKLKITANSRVGNAVRKIVNANLFCAITFVL